MAGSYHKHLLLQCLTSITSTVTLTALARCQWSSHLGLECLKLTASSWFLPNSVWLIMVCCSTNGLQLNLPAHPQCTRRTVCYFYLCRYRGGLGVYGGTASTCSTIIQGKLLQVSVVTLTLLSQKTLIYFFAFVFICISIFLYSLHLSLSLIEQIFGTASLHYFKSVLSWKEFGLFLYDQCWSCSDASL